jgi:hypothetical protein
MSSSRVIIFQHLCVCLFDQYIQNKLFKNKLKPKKVVVKERRRHTFFFFYIFIWAYFEAIPMWYIATYMLVR